MQCDDAEIELSEEPKTYSAELAEHLKGCASCQQTARVMELAALPEPTALERSALTQLPLKTHLAWRSQEARRFSVQRVAGYALAAGVGAMVASAGFLSFHTRAPLVTEPAQHTVMRQQAPVPPFDSDWDTSDDGPAAADDETPFFDVSWPSLTEGEQQ